MAGERKGYTYEALVYLALQRLKEQGKLQGEIFWNQTPAGMTIEPDLTVGYDPNVPTMVILVMHSGSAGDSHKKFWRNLEELIEAKTLLREVPRVYSVVFDAVIKENLKRLQYAAFDGQLIVGDMDYGSDLIGWVDRHYVELPRGDKQVLPTAIEERIPRDALLATMFERMAADLERLLEGRQEELDELWRMERARPRGQAPQARPTLVRRGLSKLLIFEDLDLALRLYRGQPVRADEVPDYAYQLGLARKTIAQAIPADEEVKNAVDLLSDEQIRAIVQRAPLGKMSGWLQTLRNISHVEFMGRYVLAEYHQLCQPRILAQRLQGLHQNPAALVQGYQVPKNWPPGLVWLFEYFLELMKVAEGGANKYGYARLANEVASISKQMPPPDDPVYRINLPSWVHRRPGSSLPANVIEGISQVLSGRLSKLGQETTGRLAEEVKQTYIRNTLEAKLLTYRHFEPLLTLLKGRLPKSRATHIRSAFAEKAGTAGQASKTRLIKVGRTLINWQSVTDAGRDHKKKELCGRAVGLRYTWDAKTQRFVPRPGVEKLVLVVDGTWRQEDLEALVRAGWDEIFYPDQMEQLVHAIV